MPGVGNLFIITGRINCGLLLAGRKQQPTILNFYLFIMELRADVIVYSKLGNENSNAGHTKCPRGLQVPNPDLRVWKMFGFNDIERDEMGLR